jgi:hypothetical protein
VKMTAKILSRTECIALPPHNLYKGVELLGSAEISLFPLGFDWSCFSVCYRMTV